MSEKDTCFLCSEEKPIMVAVSAGKYKDKRLCVDCWEEAVAKDKDAGPEEFKRDLEG